MAFCTGCGTEVADDAPFCSSCGAAQSTEAADQPIDPSATRVFQAPTAPGPPPSAPGSPPGASAPIEAKTSMSGRALPIALVATAVVSIITTFLPWASFLGVTFNAWDTDDGGPLVVLALLYGVPAVIAIAIGHRKTLPIITIVGAALALLNGIAQASDILDVLSIVDVSLGAGAVLYILVNIGSLALSIVWLVRSRKRQ